MTDEERADRIEEARVEHERVLPLIADAARHLKAATADLVEVRRVERIARLRH